MNYPLISEYVQSIKLAEENLDKLSNLSPVLDADGTPIMSSGNFAVVFKMQDKLTGKFYAVKCFLREQENRDESYKLIASELEYVSSTFLTPIKYLERELFVDTTQSSETEFPVLLMDWVEGLTLDRYIRNHLDDSYKLSLAAYQFCRMGAWLLSQEFAHGDLKPDNIIVKADGQLVLIDYDGMFVPAMHGRKARETGSADYRHPLRSEEVFNANIDDFSIASIALSLKAISLNPQLLGEFGADDRLLFSAKDYRDIGDSECMKAVTRLANDRELSQLLGLFYIAYARNELDYVSFKLLNLEKPEYIPVMEPEIELSTIATKEDLVDAVEDEFGVKYSKDGLRLLKALKSIERYKVREGVHIVCNSAFAGSYSLRELAIPDSVTSIGNEAFENCSSLYEVIIPDSVKNIGDFAFAECESLQELVIPNSVTNIEEGTFIECKSLRKVVIPDSVKNIGDGAFAECESLQKLVIPDSVTSIGNSAFSGCTSLQELVGPDSVTSIGNHAFYDCGSLREVVIPDSVKSIGNRAFAYCEVLHIISHNPMFRVFDDCMLIDNVNHRLISCNNYKEHIAIPNSVTSIGNDVFENCKSLHEIIIPDSVKSIEARAFSRCSSLHHVVIPDSVKSIRIGTFRSCSSLCKVVIPDSVKSIGNCAFSSCSSLREVVIPDSVKSIGNYAFSSCSSLREVVIPDSVKRIEAHVFEDCSSLFEVVIPDSVKSIGDSAFYNCRSLREVVIPDSVKSIGDSAFEDCRLLREMVIPDSVKSIGDSAFKNCSSLREVVISDSASIGAGAFWFCSSLCKVIIPNSVTSIGEWAFLGCHSLVSIIVPKNQTQRFRELLKYSSCDLSLIKEQDE